MLTFQSDSTPKTRLIDIALRRAPSIQRTMLALPRRESLTFRVISRRAVLLASIQCRYFALLRLQLLAQQTLTVCAHTPFCFTVARLRVAPP
jgi:hypothetical protein